MSGLTDKELAVRIGRDTGSTFAGLIGRSPYQAPSYWWEVQTGQRKPEVNTAMAFGNLFEEAIANAALHLFTRGEVPRQQAAGRYQRFEKPSSVFHEAHKEWLVTHPDGVLWDAHEMMQVKRHDSRLMRQYGEPGSKGMSDNDIVPLHEVIQCQIELECWRSRLDAVSERPKWQVIWLVCDFGGMNVRLYRITRDPELVALLLQVGKQTWDATMRPGNLNRPSDAEWKAWMDSGAAEKPIVARSARAVKMTTQDLLHAPIPEF